MKKIYLILIVVLTLLVISPIVIAKQGHLVLLAVKEDGKGGEYTGSAADLYLEIKPGSGRVFLETFPLSKLDTQISTRFAKDVACDYLDVECNNYDFFYTIKADSSIIGGPSAGAALSILTSAMLKDLPIDETISVTGTINSGGLIGPVGGLKAKIDAASQKNITKVIIPLGERFVKEKNNFTLDLQDYGRKYNIEVVEVADLSEAVLQFTGKKVKESSEDFVIDEGYKEIMKGLAEELCKRSEDIRKEISDTKIDPRQIDNVFLKIDENAINLSERGKKAFDEEMYYSAASYCYGANVANTHLLMVAKNETKYDNSTIKKLKDEIDKVNELINNEKIETITDLEAQMIVKERLREAEDIINQTKDDEEYVKRTAIATERINSAKSWSNFFELESKKFVFEKEDLKESCQKKIAEAEERYQYAILFFEPGLPETQENIDSAYDDLNKGDYDFCLFKASQAKAEADIILSIIGVGEEEVDTLITNKLTAVKRIISAQQEKDNFPILGYSYYEYAESLRINDKYSALLYAEYALELSNLDIYFKEKKGYEFKINYNILIFLLGFSAGVVTMMILNIRKKR